MSVVGIGTDIVDIDRILAMPEKTCEKLALRVLTVSEYNHYKQRKDSVPYLAKRWAGKEAVAKALGTGIAKGVSFQQIEIQSLESGQPVVHLTDIALQVAKAKGAASWHISLSDEKKYATAFAVLSL